MKKIVYFCTGALILVIALFIWNCTDTDLVRSSSLVGNMSFTLEEAKAFFEENTQLSVSTRANMKQAKFCISPGEFVPKWDRAIGLLKGELSRYDIPIQADYRYKAVCGESKKGKTTAQVVNVYQGLVIVKNALTGNKCQYILTLIPSRECDNKRSNSIYDDFVKNEDKGSFTGMAIYTIPQLNFIVRANCYVNGVKVEGVFMPSKRGNLEERVKVLKSILRRCIFNRTSNIFTRSEGEDDWDYGTEGKDYIELWEGYYYDKENGVILYDADGDGKPDSVWIPDVEVTPNIPTPVPDPDPIPDPVIPDLPSGVCPFCGMEGCTGECLDDIYIPVPDLEVVPCADEKNGKSVPLPRMTLAPPNPANPKGATFGKTRNNGTKMHSGIDLAGEIGDFVYAAHAGTVSRVVDNQVNRVNGKYPTDYTGDRNAAGNRIYITVSLGVEDAYFHLRAGEPIAINPRTGKQFKVGDAVEMGDIIGYIGITGNANPKVSHLHFGVRVNGKWEDPFDYINATLEDEGNNKLSISTPCDD